MMNNDDKFGVVLILPECAFSAELQRNTIANMLHELDNKLTAQGAPDEPQTRCELMMDSVLAISSMIANREIEQDAGVTDIAYCFVYAFAKAIGFEQIDLLRGLTGRYVHNQLRLNPCLSEIDYQQESSFLCKQMTDHDQNEEWDYDLALPPTVH